MSLNVITVKLFLKNLCSWTHHGGFQFLLILDLWGISFHAVIVFVLGNSILFKSVLGHCGLMKEFHPNLQIHTMNNLACCSIIKCVMGLTVKKEEDGKSQFDSCHHPNTFAKGRHKFAATCDALLLPPEEARDRVGKTTSWLKCPV